MTDAAVYDAIVKDLMNSYFHKYSISELEKAFDRSLTTLRHRGFLGTNRSDHAGEITKYLLALLLTTFVERGNMINMQRFTGLSGAITSSICNVGNFENFCQKLGGFADYVSWTHMILYIIGAFRQGKFVATFYDGTVSEHFIDTQRYPPDFLSNAILVFYGLLISRLILAAAYYPDAEERYEVEACMFATYISFYYDYVSFTKNFTVTSSVKHWELLEQTITWTYLKPGAFFLVLNTRFIMDMYFDQDNIVGVYGVINKYFIHKNKKQLSTRAATNSYDIKEAIQRLEKLDLNSISMVYNRWFRYLVYNAFMKKGKETLGLIKDTVIDTSGGIRDAVKLGASAYSLVYKKDNWPRTVTGVTVGLVAFAGSAWYRFARNRLNWGWKQLAVATAYAFRKDEFFYIKLAEPKFTPPSQAPYLEMIRSPDGSYSIIYSVTPIPTPIYDGQYAQGGGGGRTTTKTKKKSHAEMLKKAMKKGYIKNALPVEMQDYIKKKLQINTDMRGGGRRWSLLGGQGSPDITQYDEDDDFLLPPGYTREVIAVAEDKAFIREDEDGETLQLVLPKTELEREAIENAVFVDVAEPALKVEKPPTAPNRLPDLIPENDAERTIPTQASLSTPSTSSTHDLPPPPINPAISMPNLSEKQAMKIFEQSTAPQERQFVKFTRRKHTGRRRYR